MKHLFAAFILAVTATCLAAGQTRAGRSPSVPQKAKYQAVVDADEAVFTFPLTASQKYGFCSRGLNYGWHVEVSSEGREFEFGFTFIPKWAASPCGQGNIQKLLRKGQYDLYTKIVEGNSTSYTLVTGLTEEGFVTYADNIDGPFLETPLVSGSAGRNKLTIKLAGKRSLQRLFAAMPGHITFTTQLLDDIKTQSVPITYTARFLSDMMLLKGDGGKPQPEQ